MMLFIKDLLKYYKFKSLCYSHLWSLNVYNTDKKPLTIYRLSFRGFLPDTVCFQRQEKFPAKTMQDAEYYILVHW